ncbi:arabinan endo-1,5-alpha-L-arabinosidase [Lacibacter sp. H375]|uniref:arabinan endo-1,5-alpha-L-arabinosidase n=1 Tax=Lacibacter sp. H375 TaxID=3133424 RepID=UPI0030BF4335
MKQFQSIKLSSLIVAFLLLMGACKKNSGGGSTPDPVLPPVAVFDINSINDTYGPIAPFANFLQWGPHNTHDPAIIKDGEFYYSYSTDVGYGIDVRAGLQIRRSKDLVQWTFVGWVFNNLPAMGAAYITQAGGTPFNSLWAPCVVKVGSEYRLYYSLSSAVPRLSVIGMATATNPVGPWTEKGLAVTSLNNNSVQTNAIDPSVIITATGEHWMHYGSGWDGIYALQLNPSTGLALVSGDKGKRIANRGFTGGRYNGNIEGPDIIYNEALKKYYLFIAYDWLETKYNVRVMRGDKPDGPFYDYNGADANLNVDHGPMIIAPYKFAGHSGWQGVSHSTTFSDGTGNYFIAHQGRPGIDRFYMNMHVRKLFWTQDGWPVASPERYAWEKDSLISQADITGEWEQIVLGYNVVPGYAAEQTNPDFQNSVNLTINANGTLNGNAANTWTYTAPWLQLNWANGFTDKVYVQKGRDWENKKNTIIFTGLNNQGTAIWGKKK